MDSGIDLILVCGFFGSVGNSLLCGGGVFVHFSVD